MTRIPVEDFFRKPKRAATTIAPDGRHVAFLAPWERRMNLFIRNLATGGERRLTHASARDIVDYAWASSDSLVFLHDVDGDENWQVCAVSIDGGDARSLTPRDGVQARLLSDLPDLDDLILVGLNDREPRLHDPYILNVRTGERRPAAVNPGNVFRWLADHDGFVRVAVALEGTDTLILVRDDEVSPWRTLLQVGLRDDVIPLAITADRKAMYAACNLGRPTKAIVERNLDDGSIVRVLADRSDVDVDELFISRRRRVPTHLRVEAERPSFFCLDPTHAAWQKRVDEHLPDRVNCFTSASRDERLWTIHSSSDRVPGSHWLFDTEAGVLTHLWDATPWLAAEALCSVEPIAFCARDGRTIPGYLTRPREAVGPVALIVLPHGGPWHRDTWRYQPDVQLLANRGYAVIQPNFRGSTGYGREHWEASFGQWGLAMQDDIEDAVQWAVSGGIADPARVAIYGGSYGGYATLSGIVKTPHLYRCAVNVCGVSNILSWMAAIPPYWELFRAQIDVMVGHPERDRERLEATSPALHADRIQTPLFIAQGATDPRVRKEESDQMVDVLRRRGVDVEYMVKEDEGHGFLKEENRMEFYLALERFLARHLGPDTP